MKVIFEDQGVGGRASDAYARFAVFGETDCLTDVLLCTPDHLAPVPCCSVTKASIRDGFQTSTAIALEQHAALRRALEAQGVRCHLIAPSPEMPDLCFTRDNMVVTPWGPVTLRPALLHREGEAKHAALAVKRMQIGPVTGLQTGKIEGGDVCIARPGLLIVGLSGERTDEAGAAALVAPFERDGWHVLKFRFDPHFLHLDTIFCMLDPHRALVCTDVVDDEFLSDLSDCGVEAVPVTYKEARNLGCNVVSVDGKTIIAAAGTPRVSGLMRELGYAVVEVDVDQFTACGGGIHCLTMPLRRVASTRELA